MYKAKGPFGPHIRRADALKDLVYQLEVIESRAHPKGPYLVGESQSLADATIFPTS
jgi:glutathione S-transferase